MKIQHKGFIWGAVVGVAGVYLYHHFIHPLPGPAKG